MQYIFNYLVLVGVSWLVALFSSYYFRKLGKDYSRAMKIQLGIYLKKLKYVFTTWDHS